MYALVVIIESLLQFVGNVVGERQSEVVRVVLRVQLYGFFVQFNRLPVVLQFAVHVRQIELNRLQNLVSRPDRQGKRRFEFVLGLGVIFMFIINHSSLVVDLRVERIYVFCLLKR